ncbi:MAG: diguanylate cyclase [Gammaproteobacteria bacterium]|nr:diguanylate cyclase [Gammaproteobacteria bacterium]
MIETLYQNEAAIRLSIFLGAFLLLALWEWRWPKRVLTQNKIKRWFNNIALMITGTLVVRVVIPVAAIGVSYIAAQQHLGFANHFELPLWLEVIIVFVILDLAIYFQHAMFHVLPVMWRFHRVHHSDLDYDITTGVRFHPIEILISVFIKMFLIVALGAPVLVVILFEIALNFMSMFTHSNIYLNEKVERLLRWFIVTPDMHRVHHSIQENETNSNFAFNISAWDRIFGTYRAEPKAGQLGMTIGLTQFREKKWQNYGGLLSTPFSSNVRGYAINYRDTVNARELTQAKEIALQNEEKAKLAIELDSYLEAIGQHALVSAADSDGNIIEVNDKFCEVSGYSREEMLGQNHRIINSGIHDKDFFEKMWSTITSGKKWHGEICNRAKNGELYWVDGAIVPVRGVDGEIERYVSVRLDISKRKKYELSIERVNQALTDANMQLETLSQIDSLTGIANRRRFDDVLSEYMSTMSRSGASLTLMLCDVDYFKNYNDLYGHQAGDNCLCKVAKSIEENFTRSGDLVARYGGEEFAVILPNINKETALMLAERMRANVEQLALEHGNSPITEVVTISAGVVTLLLDKNIKTETIIAKADKALYRAKEIGRNRIEISS